MQKKPWIIDNKLHEIRVLAEQLNSQPSSISHIEFNSPAIAKTVDLLLIPDAQIDEMSVNRGKLFKKRFWKDIPSTYRRKMIDLKIENDWTETQFKILLLSGFVKADQKIGCIKIYKDYYAYLYGWLQVLILTTLFSTGLISIIASTHPSIRQLMGVSAILVSAIFAIWLIYITHIAPYNIIKLSSISRECKPFTAIR